MTINLAPADLRKEGPAYDLPIAVGILAAQPGDRRPDDTLIIGRIEPGWQRPPCQWGAADGQHGAASAAIGDFVPTVDAPEAALVEGLDVFPIDTLANLVAHLNGQQAIAR